MKSKFFDELKSSRNVSSRHLVYGLVIFLILIFSSISLTNLSPYNSKASGVQFFRAKVLSVNKVGNGLGANQYIRSKLLDGPNKNQVITVSRGDNFGDTSYNRIPVGSQILLSRSKGLGNQYSYADRWRLPGIVTLFLLLLFLVIIVGWWRGLTSLAGLLITVGVLSVYTIPSILDGHSIYLACIISAFIITLISVYIAHGINKRTSVALLSSLITLGLVVGLVALSTYLAGTSEVINEGTYPTLYNGSHYISLSGLFTGGIIIGSLGVLYDITTGQSAAVDEVYKANKKLGLYELYRKGLSVGREHIAALINTLALVYVGVALPSIIITILYSNHAPLAIAINNEAVVEEIVRVFVASMGMLLSVPIATFLAAYCLPKWYEYKAK